MRRLHSPSNQKHTASTSIVCDGGRRLQALKTLGAAEGGRRSVDLPGAAGSDPAWTWWPCWLERLIPWGSCSSNGLRTNLVVLRFGYRNCIWVTEVVHLHPIGLPGGPGSDRRDDRHAQGDRADHHRDVGRAGRCHGDEERWQQRGDQCPEILGDGHPRDPGTRW